MNDGSVVPASGPPMVTAAQIDLAGKQIQFARRYTKRLIEDVDQSEWFQIPDGSPTHLAWQIGHLAMAEYGLTLLRIRGKEPSDREFITNDFLRKFKRDSTPTADPEFYPTIGEILTVFDAVHEHALQAIPQYDAGTLAESLPLPTAAYPTKLGALLFCSVHEMLHAGQIGLLRRLLGKPPMGPLE